MRTLDSLDKQEFEALVNQLFRAEFGDKGEFIAYPTPPGVNDAGYDARFKGPVGGVTADWTISAKHTTGNLKPLLARDLVKHPGRHWLVATNQRVPTNDPLRDWLANEAPGSKVFGGDALCDMLKGHPWLRRYYGLADGVASLLFQPLKAGHSKPIPQSLRGLIDDGCARAMAGERTAFIGALAAGQLELVKAEVEGRFARELIGYVPLVVLDALTLEGAAASLRPEATRYLFVVPPSRQALSVLDTLAKLPSPLDRPHGIVVFLSQLQAIVLRKSLGLHRVELPVVTREEHHALLRTMRAGLRHDRAAALAGLAGTSTAALYALLAASKEELDALDDAVGHLVSAIVDGTEPMLGAAVLGWLLLLVDETHALVPPLVDVARVTEAPLALVEAIRFNAVKEGLFSGEDGKLRHASPLVSAMVLQAERNRVRSSVVGAHLGQLSAEQRWRAARQLGRLGHETEVVRAEVVSSISLARAGSFKQADRAVTRAAEVARYDEELGRLAVEVAQAALAQVTSDDPFAGTETTWDLEMRVRFSPVLGRHCASALAAAAHWPSLVHRVVDMLVGLPTGSRGASDQFARELVDPQFPEALATVVGALASRVADPVAAELLAAVAEVALAHAPSVTSQVGGTLTIGRVPWAETPALDAMRCACVDALLSATRASSRRVRAAGWRGLHKLWGAHSAFGGEPGPPGPMVAELAERVIARAEETAGERDWRDKNDAESVVLACTARELLPPIRLAAAIRGFSVEPGYRLWRSLRRRNYLLDVPRAAADALEAGGGWEATVRHSETVWHGAEWAESDVARLIEAYPSVESIVGLLEQVAVTDDEPATESWFQFDMLRLWVARAKTTFEGVLFTARADALPPTMLARLVASALPVFGDRLRRAVARPLLDSSTLGVARTLAAMLSAPQSVSDARWEALLPVAIDLVTPPNRTALLFGGAEHPSPRVKLAVARALTDWMMYDPDPPRVRDALAIVDRLIGDPPTVDSLWPLTHGLADRPGSHRAELLDAVCARLGWAILRVDWRYPGFDTDRLHGVFVAGRAHDPDGWVEWLVVHDVVNEVTFPPTTDVKILRLALSRAPGPGLGSWRRPLEACVPDLPIDAALALANERLAADRWGAAQLLAMCADPSAHAWWQAVEAVVTDDLLAEFAESVTVRWLDAGFRVGDDLAAPWTGGSLVVRGDVGLRVARRVAAQLHSVRDNVGSPS